MGMKTILVPAEHHPTMRATLQSVLLLARRCDSYVEGFALRLGINEFVTVDMAGAFPLDAYKQESIEDARRARELFETAMREEQVPPAGDRSAPARLSYGWLEDAPEGEGFVGSYGRVFDVIALSRPESSAISLHNRALESALFESGRPVLVCPPEPPRSLGRNVLIAWNCSTEQARVTALAMPILTQAERVVVLTIAGGQAVPGPSGEQMVRCLRQNGVAAEPMTVPIGERSTGEAVLATAASLGSDLLVKGAYTQSRLRQMIFGGTTQHILAHASLPVLMAH
jgi:nucleotide-binding universal stress UspA family protein